MLELSFAQVFKRLIVQYILPYKSKIIITIICMVIVALTSSFQVWLVKPALDKIFVNKDSAMLGYLPILVIVISTIRGIAAYFQNFTMKYIGQRVTTDLQIILYSHLLHADLAYLHNYSTGKIISKFTNDINVIRNSVLNILNGVFKECLTVIFLIILMFYQSFTLALIGFVVFPVAILPIMKMGKKMRKISAATQSELANFVSHLDDSFQLIKIIKAYCKEEFEKSRVSKIIENIFYLYTKAIRIESLVSPIMEALSGIAIGAIIWYGGKQVIDGATSPGAFFSFIVAFIAAYKPLKALASLNTNFQEGLTSAKRIFAVLDQKSKIQNSLSCINLPTNIEGGIEFNNVKFVYPNGKVVIDDLSLNIESGKIIAFVGASGGGKSTIINLLLRLYDVEQGKITIDGYDIRDLSINSLRENISLVTQETLLFNDTILANIRYSKASATEEEVIEAAKASLVHDFIETLPNGYNTVIGQYGVKLSGGQKQRISIARAFLKNSKILILDEATSALDNNSESFIKNTIQNWHEKKTIIIIAHRLTTIVEADLIFVFKNGKIVEYGNHEKLLNMNMEYSKLYKKES